MTVESYLHKYAKIVVAAWLRKKIRLGSTFQGLNNIPIAINTPIGTPMYNVYTEYPVCLDKNDNSIVGLQCSWTDWLDKNNVQVHGKHNVPTFKELKDEHLKDKLKILYVFDIGIVDDGKLKYIFEIEHTSPCTDDKIKFINDNKIIAYELSAQKIMEQVKLPYCFEPSKKWNV